MADLAGLQPELQRRGAAVVLVHQSPPEAGAAAVREYPGAEAFHLVSDRPEGTRCRLYARFGLGRAALGEMLSPALWLRGTEAFLHGHRQGAPAGSVPQKPGAFVLRNGAVVAAHRYRTLGDRPDYLALLDLGLRDASP